MVLSISLSVLLSLSALSVATPAANISARQDVQNIVYVTNANKYCMIVPRNPKTNIGDSQYPGGMKTYCSPAGRYSPNQGQLPADWWRHVEFKSGSSPSGKRFAQLTGCINANHLSRLNPSDEGGQYSSAGQPTGAICLGYQRYVELIEPAQNRACIKCCDDPKDCPTDKPTQGCPNVIRGNYFDCGN